MSGKIVAMSHPELLSSQQCGPYLLEKLMQFFSRYDMSQTLHESPLEICEALAVGFQAKKFLRPPQKRYHTQGILQ